MWEAEEDCGQRAKRWERMRTQVSRYKQTECTVHERTQVGRGQARTQRLSVAFRREVSESDILFYFFPQRNRTRPLNKRAYCCAASLGRHVPNCLIVSECQANG